MVGEGGSGGDDSEGARDMRTWKGKRWLWDALGGVWMLISRTACVLRWVMKERCMISDETCTMKVIVDWRRCFYADDILAS